MSFEQRFALVLLAAFFLSSVATSVAAALISPALLWRRGTWTSREAAALALFRLLPATSALALTVFVLGPGYFAHEQRGEPEGSGYALIALALGGLWIAAASVARLAQAWRRTAAIRRQWLAAGREVSIPDAGMPAYVLDFPFPLVAVLGFARPRLFVSQTVLDACSADEMRAIVEHERAHMRRRDNAVRLLMDATPDLLSLTRVPDAVAGAWHQAVEHRADDAASRRLDLASALVKVARLATLGAPATASAIELPASALYRGEGREMIGARVRRLVGDELDSGRPHWIAALAGCTVALGAVVAAAAATGAASRLAHAVPRSPSRGFPDVRALVVAAIAFYISLMRSLVLSMALLLTAAGTATASQFRLIDVRTGDPIAGAEVSILGQPGTVRTDASGRFSWTPDPQPPFELLIVLPDGSLARPVFVERLDAGELTLRVDAVVAEQITVSGAAPSIDVAPAAGMTSISGRDIAVRSPENLIQALENVAGVNQVSEGHAGVPALRGLSAGRTLILLDGARVTSERRVGPSATFLDPGVVEGVDVARGPGSVAYGSDAFGGVISARTRRVEAGAPLHARVLATAGAGIPEQRYSAEIGRGFARTGLFVQAHARNAEDYESPQGTVFNSGWADKGFLVRTTHALGANHLSLGWQSDFATDLERPRNNSSSVRFFYPTDDSHRFTANYRLADAGPFGRVDVDAFLGRYVNVTDQDTFATATRARAVERADVSANDYQVRAVSERMLGNARVMAGVDINGRFNLETLDIVEAYDLSGARTGVSSNVSVDGADRRDTGVFVQADRALGARVAASAGGRVDYVTTTSPGGFFGERSTANGAASGFVAATVVPFDGLTVTGQLSRGFRDPVLSDRYFRGPSGRGFVTGNPDLDPESSLQVDGAVRYTTSAARIGINAYHYTISDLIERYGDGDDFFFRNRGNAVIAGLEAEAQVALPEAVALEMTAQIARGETSGDGAPLDGIAPATLTALARKLFGARGFAQARVAWFAEDDTPGPTEREVNGYTLVDVVAGVTVSRHVELRAQARNLFDATYFAAQSTRAVLGPGRSASLTAVLSY